MKDILIQYLRKEKKIGENIIREPYAAMVAINHEGKISFGFALCNKKDEFNKAIGRYIATQRASVYFTKNRRGSISLPASLHEDAKKFIGRSKAYFQNSSVLEEFENL